MTKLIDAVKRLLSGYKTYIAAAGLFGLAVYQLSTGDYATAYQTLMAALATAGMRAAVAKNGYGN